MNVKQPRGIRNGNPGNIRRSKDAWQGLLPEKEQTDPDFFNFIPVYGIRALARTLIAYQDKHGLDCISDIVNRWAPRVENDTAAYAASVAHQTGLDPFEPLNLHSHEHLSPLVKAIIRHENGQQPYTDAQIDKALSLAGVEPIKPKSLQKSRTVKGSQGAAVGGLSIATVGASLSEFAPAVPVLKQIGEFARENLTLLLVCIGIAVVAGAGWAIWAKIDDRRKGIA